MFLIGRAGRLAAAIVAVLVVISPWSSASAAIVSESLHTEVTRVRTHPRTVAAAQTETTEPATGKLGAYRHLGTWVDMYDAGPWKNPERAVRRMSRKGVTTLYLQTANYKKPRRDTIFKRAKMGRLIVAAHAKGIKVVAWYLPSFRNMEKDWRRTKAALNFRTADGQTFDSFALDIESTREPDIATRNRRLENLSKRIRSHVGGDYTLGAIVPDVYTYYWPSFPYRMVNRLYDVFLPMGYFSYRVSGYSAVYSYTRANIRAIRDRTGNPNAKIHPIGGIAGDAGTPAARGFVKAVKDHGVLGGSYYDFPITTSDEWTVLGRLAR